MASNLSKDEKAERLRILRDSETLTEAADRSGISVGAMWQWAKAHYPGYEEQFKRSTNNDTGGDDEPTENVDEAQYDFQLPYEVTASIRWTLTIMQAPEFKEAATMHPLAARRYQQAVAELEFALDQAE